MMFSSRLHWLRGIVLGGGLLAASQAMAYTNFALDELRLQWSNDDVSISFVDRFDNGDPLLGGTYTNLGAGGTLTPTETNYWAGTRSGAAPTVGSESGGKLAFAWGDMADSYFGGAVVGRSLSYILFTATQYSTGGSLGNRGLWKGNDFGVQTIWDLAQPLNGDQARMRLTDAYTGHFSNDVVELGFRRMGDGYGLHSRRLNAAGGAIDELVVTDDISTLAGDADQIMLRFSHEAGNDFVSTGYAFLKAGAVVHEATVGTLSLFHGEDWTRASFGTYAFAAPVPEPETLALWLVGLTGLAALRRRQG
ncbi:MAG: PEP-CTERM sorting domain-containing protein [Burkholderiales bacterium]|nr:PEP-CTERM sorting domain-containing protein [Burkholderiales bacterium]